MRKYIIGLVGAVFLGSQLLAISTPFLQITPYRILVVGLLAIILLQLFKEDQTLKLSADNTATTLVMIFSIWWLWGAISSIWTLSFTNWFQAMFLLTLGVVSIIGLYLYINDDQLWQIAIRAIWLMMTFLALWGLYEILTNNYLFADLQALDKNGIFATQPLRRIPITTFANQNDYATLLLAYLPINLIMIQLDRHSLRRLLYLIPLVMAGFLVYRSESRMILLSYGLFFVIVLALQLKLDVKQRSMWLGLGLLIVVISLIIAFIPAVRDKLSQLIYLGGDFFNTGDSRRVNLWRNGLLFLAQTYGFGVGAGNIEVWMGRLAFLPVDEFTNIHNWWLEILVGYGVVIFVLYIVAYGMMLRALNRIRLREKGPIRMIAINYMAFLLVFIIASITSANNMLIEWHWVYFGVLISFIKLQEQHAKKRKNEGLT